MRRFRVPPITMLGAVLAMLGLLAGCQPAASPTLSDPREIVTRTIVATAALRTASVRAEIEMRTAANAEFQMPARIDGGSLEGAVDLAAGEMSFRGAGRDGGGDFAMRIVDGHMYMQMAVLDGAAERWMAMPTNGGAVPAGLFMFGMPGGQTPDYAAILQESMAGPGIRMQLAGVEDCPGGSCYRLAMAIDREAIWPLVARLFGLDQIPGMEEPPAEDMPQLSVIAHVDTGALHLVSLDLSGTVNADTFRARLQISDPNEPVSIEPPPEHLVDRVDDGFGGGGVPQPVPAEPVPAEPVPAEPVPGEWAPAPIGTAPPAPEP